MCKIGTSQRATRDLATVYGLLLSARSPLLRKAGGAVDASLQPDDGRTRPGLYVAEGAYRSFVRRVLVAEADVLAAVGFDTHVALPHPLAITYLQALDFLGFDEPDEELDLDAMDEDGGEATARQQPRPRSRRRLASAVVAHLNGALLSPQLLYLTHQPHALAVAAIYCAARAEGAKMPYSTAPSSPRSDEDGADPPLSEWWEVFDVDREELGFLVMAMRSVAPWAERMVLPREAALENVAAGGLPVWSLGGRGMLTRAMVEEELTRRGL